MNKSYKIIVYTSDNCVFCNSIKKLLKNKKLKFEEVNISKNDSLKKKMIEKTNGIMTVPQIFINSKSFILLPVRGSNSAILSILSLKMDILQALSSKCEVKISKLSPLTLNVPL